MTKTKTQFKTRRKIESGRFLNIRNFNKLLGTLIIAIIVYYVTGINDLTVKGFKLQELKKRKTNLVEKNENMRLKTMSLESYNNLVSRAEKMNLVSVGGVDYISAMEDVVAKK